MPEQSIPFKVFSLVLVLALSLSGMVFSLNTKGQIHRLLGRLTYGAFGFAGLAGLFWSLPLGEEFVSLSLLLMLYLVSASWAWGRPLGPVRIDRAINGMALMASIAAVLTAISVCLGFRAETMTVSDAPLAVVFGVFGLEIARRNMAWLNDVPEADKRQRLHSLHSTGAFCVLFSAFGYVLGLRLGFEPLIGALLFILAAAPVFWWRYRALNLSSDIGD